MKEIAVIAFFLLASFVFSFSAPSENNDVVSLQVQKESVIEDVVEKIDIKEYIVNGNDNLWIISKMVYGVGHKWNIIYQANISKIKNSNILIPGTRLIIPDKNTKVEINMDVVPPGYRYRETVYARVTAYTPYKSCCGKWADGKTSIMKSAMNELGCATDPRAIPYGCVVDIPGVRLRRVDDTGGAMRKAWDRIYYKNGRRYSKPTYHIDVRVLSRTRANKWGSRWMNVKIYKPI